MSKLVSILPSNIMFMLYNTLILPYLNYCIIIWGRACSSIIKPLIILQKKAIRLCTKSHFGAHAPPLFEGVKTLSLHDLHSVNLAMFMYNYVNKFLPSSFSNFINVNSDFHNHYTRTRGFYRPPSSRLALTERKSVKVHGSLLWNSLSNSLKMSRSLYSFKRQLKKELLNSYL